MITCSKRRCRLRCDKGTRSFGPFCTMYIIRCYNKHTVSIQVSPGIYMRSTLMIQMTSHPHITFEMVVECTTDMLWSSLFHSTHSGCPIAHPLGRNMGCLWWVYDATNRSNLEVNVLYITVLYRETRNYMERTSWNTYILANIDYY